MKYLKYEIWFLNSIIYLFIIYLRPYDIFYPRHIRPNTSIHAGSTAQPTLSSIRGHPQYCEYTFLVLIRMKRTTAVSLMKTNISMKIDQRVSLNLFHINSFGVPIVEKFTVVSSWCEIISLYLSLLLLINKTSLKVWITDISTREDGNFYTLVRP